MSIQWYPGHMTKARRELAAAMPAQDVIIEVLDARMPAASENPVPSSTSTVFAPAFTRWNAAAGATYDTGSVAWHVAYVHSFREEVRVGSSDVAQDFDGSKIGFAVDSIALGVSVRF